MGLVWKLKTYNPSFFKENGAERFEQLEHKLRPSRAEETKNRPSSLEAMSEISVELILVRGRNAR